MDILDPIMAESAVKIVSQQHNDSTHYKLDLKVPPFVNLPQNENAKLKLVGRNNNKKNRTEEGGGAKNQVFLDPVYHN